MHLERDMTVASHLIKFQVILENTHAWAVREQRPRISTYIDLWKSTYPVGEEIQRKPTRITVIVILEPVNTPTAEADDVGCPGSESPSSPASSLDCPSRRIRSP